MPNERAVKRLKLAMLESALAETVLTLNKLWDLAAECREYGIGQEIMNASIAAESAQREANERFEAFEHGE